MDYGKTVSRAWEITWKNKWLWILGFLAALAGGGSSGSFGGGGGNSGTSIDGGTEMPPFLQNSPFGPFLERLMSGETEALMALFGTLAVVFALLCLVGIVLWFVGQAARAGLILAVDRIEQGETWSFGPAFRAGAGYLMPIFLFKLLVAVVPLLIIVVPGVLLVIGGVGAIAGSDSAGFGTGLIVLACAAFCLLVPLAFVLQFIDAYGYRGLVLRRMGIVDALRHGWQTFRAHLGDSLILGIIVTVISWVVGFITLVVASPFIALVAVPVIAAINSGTIGTAGTLSIIGGVLGLIVVSALINSVVTAWRSAIFTLAYRDWTGLAPKVAAPLPPDDPFSPIGREKTPDDIDKSSMI